MSRSRRTRQMSEALRRAILRSKTPLMSLEQATGVKRASIMRFLRGETSLRLDKADALAAYFGLELVAKKSK